MTAMLDTAQCMGIFDIHNISETEFISVMMRELGGRTKAETVSRWLPTAAVRGLILGLSCGILWWTK
jgi:hypothetical protein